MGMLGQRAVKGYGCTLTAMKGERAITVKGTITGINEALIMITVADPSKIDRLADADKVILNSADVNNHKYSATDASLKFSKKDPSLVAMSAGVRTAYLNNREYPRYPYAADVAIQTSRNGSWISGRCINISQGGIAIESETRFANDTKLTLELYDKYRAKQITIDAVVRHIELMQSGKFLLGCMAEETPDAMVLVDAIMEDMMESSTV